MTSQRLVSGIQPTGKMHLGNFLGAVKNWTELQTQFQSFFMIADLHALTTVYENPAQLKSDKLELATDLLAAGIDPSQACLFFQSDVPEHSELHLILSMITPTPWLTRVPTYKSKIEEISEKNLDTYGFLGYPVLQTADILLYKANVVPVGKDQIPHLELSREIARRFNHFYGPIFPEPQDSLTHFPILPGLDGRKMSKSYNNTIPINETDDETHKRVMSMFTDPTRLRRSDPGHPETCPVYSFHHIFSPEKRQSEIADQCRGAVLGCVDCKKECAAQVIEFLKPVRTKRNTFANDLGEVDRLLKTGAEKARETASVTLKHVHEAIGL
jgi:tryptophanyl-tRNA synthetase